MTASRPLVCCLLVGVAAAGGCRSQLQSVFSVAAGKSTADNVFPQQPDPRLAAAAAPQPTSQAAQHEALHETLHETRRDPLPAPTRDEALQAILGDLQQLSVTNPAAERELLAQLQSADPRYWDQIVQRFKATLAYHEQLTRPDAFETRLASHTQSHGHGNGPNNGPNNVQSNGHRHPTSHGSSSRPMPGGHSQTTRPADARAGNQWPGQPPQGSARPEGSSGRDAPTRLEFDPPPLTHREPAVEPYPSTDDPQRRADVVQLASAAIPIAPPPAAEVETEPGAEPEAEPAPRAAFEADWRATLQMAIQDLETRVVAEPQTVGEAYDHVRLRLLQLAAGDLNAAAAPALGLSPTEQNYWSEQLFALGQMLGEAEQPEGKRRASAAELHLAKAHASLRQLSNLSVRNLTFCSEILAYGVYTERRSRRFKPGEEVMLYIEVENFKTEQNEKGDYRTVIGTSSRVLDSRGVEVGGLELPTVEETASSRRRDFFIQYWITLPERIYPGEYQLELTLTDQLGSKIGRSSIDFEIVESDE